jgi:hypothetical protein
MIPKPTHTCVKKPSELPPTSAFLSSTGNQRVVSRCVLPGSGAVNLLHGDRAVNRMEALMRMAMSEEGRHSICWGRCKSLCIFASISFPPSRGRTKQRNSTLSLKRRPDGSSGSITAIFAPDYSVSNCLIFRSRVDSRESRRVSISYGPAPLNGIRCLMASTTHSWSRVVRSSKTNRWK